MDETREGTVDEVTTAAGRRAAERHRARPNRPCQFVTWPDCRGRRALVHDVSATGIALLLNEPLEAGRDIMIRLPAVGSSPAYTLFGKVAHAMSAPEGWRIGCALSRTLSEPEIAALL
ncbi:MAG TPA: PilZ domain-containing protein [Gemmataceae bacterium]|nr:PilZ domain-containing protein [Gemmataceae bacterium]